MKEYIMETSDTGWVTKVKQEIVRCKDCKYWQDESERDEHPSWLPCMDVQTRNDFFCADGEKK